MHSVMSNAGGIKVSDDEDEDEVVQMRRRPEDYVQDMG
jgi:hypothetical protein